MGSATCTSNTGACNGAAGGFSAAISENLWAPPLPYENSTTCGECWQLTAEGRAPVVVRIDNLCPRAGNEAMCGQRDKKGKNSVGMCDSLWSYSFAG